MIPANDDLPALSIDDLRYRIANAAVAAFRCRTADYDDPEDGKALARAAARYDELVNSHASALARAMSSLRVAGAR